jgi:hypothetical protein
VGSSWTVALTFAIAGESLCAAVFKGIAFDQQNCDHPSFLPHKLWDPR